MSEKEELDVRMSFVLPSDRAADVLAFAAIAASWNVDDAQLPYHALDRLPILAEQLQDFAVWALQEYGDCEPLRDDRVQLLTDFGGLVLKILVEERRGANQYDYQVVAVPKRPEYGEEIRL